MMIQNERILREENSRLQTSSDEAKKLADSMAKEAKRLETEAKEVKRLAEIVAEEHKMALANVKGSLVAVQKELQKEKSETEATKS